MKPGWAVSALIFRIAHKKSLIWGMRRLLLAS